jgi:hypothetical protein
MNKENNQLNTLLNAYSIQEITSLFALIDEKILSLHNCSSEDFLSLNSYFKKYYKDSKVISQNASDILNIITDQEKKEEIFNGLNIFHSRLSQHLLGFNNVSSGLISAFDKIIQEIEHMFVPSNNLKQDLMTLKLLVANLKIDITLSTESFGKMNRKANDFNEIIIQTKSFFTEFYNNFTQLKSQLKQNIKFVSELREKNSDNIGEILTELQNGSSLFNLKYKEAQNLVPKLKESTESTASNIGKIITNLQYHDIIRQKIEHIQHTHEEILKELNKVSNDNADELNQQLQVKCFVQIRDVAGLQAAQLIHANKEYQKAIEIISEKFLQVGNEMTGISDMCHKFISNSSSSSQSHFKDIIDKVERTSYFIGVYEKSINQLKDRYIKSKTQFDDIMNNYFELSDFFTTLERNILKAISSQSVPETENTTINNIKQILNDLRSILNQHQGLFDKVKELYSGADQAVVSYFKDDLAQNSLQELFQLSENITSFLKDSNDKVYKTIEENQILSRQVSYDIKSSLEQIKYYDYFDRTIDEIIGQLNEINIKLQNIESIDEEHKRQNLEHLKSQYTMQSEHIIHDSISNEKNLSQADIVSIESTGVDEDDDNLELF